MRVCARLLSAACVLAAVSSAYAQDKKPEGKPAPAGKPAAAAPAAGKAEVGKPAPDFTLKDLDGKEYKLSSLKGKVVVLEWTNHECPIVKAHHEDGNDKMKATYDTFKGKDVVWLAVNSSYFCEDKKEEIKGWVKQKGLPYPMLLDASGAVGHSFDAKTTPHMFIVDKDGNLAYAGSLDNSNDKNASAKHNYVAEAVTSLLAGQTVAVKSTQPFGCSVKFKN